MASQPDREVRHVDCDIFFRVPSIYDLPMSQPQRRPIVSRRRYSRRIWMREAIIMPESDAGELEYVGFYPRHRRASNLGLY
jgi:hypothetical protein